MKKSTYARLARFRIATHIALLSTALLMTGSFAQAGMAVKKWQKMTNREVNLCRWGKSKSGLGDLHQKIESAVQEQIGSIGNFKLLRDWPACESLPTKDMYPYIGILIFDDPAFDDAKFKKEILTKRDYFTYLEEDKKPAPGHPTAIGLGQGIKLQMFDLVLTSRFQQVQPGLVESASKLSPQGKENLILSIAVHELLHVFGIHHEHTHPQSSCLIPDDLPLGADNVYADSVGQYDKTSIMDYCLTRKYDYEKGPLKMSPGDIQTLLSVYPK